MKTTPQTLLRPSSETTPLPSTSPTPPAPPKLPPHSPHAPTTKLTAHQAFYLLGLHGAAAALLSGAINFAVAYALYTAPAARRHPVRLFALPNTLVGDAAVTAVVQCLVTWMVELGVVGGDLRKGVVAPVGFVGVEPGGRVGRWFFGLEGEEEEEEEGEGEGEGEAAWKGAVVLAWGTYILGQVVRSLVVAVVIFALMFGPTVGILMAVGRKSGGDWEFGRVWAPQFFKLVYGGVMALLTTPFMAFVWMARSGWLVSRGRERWSVS